MATVAAKINIANWFEIPVKDLERATTFYEKVFDVKLIPEEMSGIKMEMFPFEQGAAGAAGALIKGKTYEPSHAGTGAGSCCPEHLSDSTGSLGSTRTPKATGWRSIP
jgi:predicted enzyme related to lactoylglutathione lyase